MNRLRIGLVAGVVFCVPCLVGCAGNAAMTAEDRATITAVALADDTKAEGPSFVSEAGAVVGVLVSPVEGRKAEPLMETWKKNPLPVDKMVAAEFDRAARANSGGLKFADAATPADAHFHLSVEYGFAENKRITHVVINLKATLIRDSDKKVLWRHTEESTETDAPGYPLSQYAGYPQIFKPVFTETIQKVVARTVASIGAK